MRWIGDMAEELSVQWVIQQGLRVYARNWSCRFGEIDLICQQEDIWVFIEVKYRRSKNFGGALESISPAKCRKLNMSIQTFLQRYELNDVPCRVDALLWEGIGCEEPVWLQNIELFS
jgi:putative endonuclease